MHAAHALLLGLVLLPTTQDRAAVPASSELPQEARQDQEDDDGLRPALPPYLDPLEEEEFFQTADYDGNGWISFEEARDSLLLDRAGFFAFDTDKDLRLSAKEFSARYRDSIERTGGFQPPIPKSAAELAPPRSAVELRNAFDRNLDGRLGALELDAFVEDYALPKITGEEVLAQLDTDGSGTLELVELGAMSALIDAYKQAPAGMFEEGPRPKSIEDLYGELVPRESAFSVDEPPYMRGPVRPFWRLDLDRDGGIEERDLFDLQYPLTLPVRASSVIAALDRDGDRSLSRAEFRASME